MHTLIQNIICIFSSILGILGYICVYKNRNHTPRCLMREAGSYFLWLYCYMSSNEVLTEELLHLATAELATALNDILPPPNEYQHNFSDNFERKIQMLIKGIGTKCYTAAIQDSVIHKYVKRRFGFIPNRRSITPTTVVTHCYCYKNDVYFSWVNFLDC